ncbi:DUF3526 domain-containing protein [Pseudoalteromonas sp. C2R02]|uniref:DUF3526 domain-containing protein n=1 Tax=Pseudoalteromonas sp. C2R02 TaxID=2841565 RepID=UPI001C089C4C|nr:DUF3526 domain-containing protein [Pseudoalteromonas sp. C2R02]MBU2969175.1 DUF3526 domain-containing protein [Pseudoalteromonas sp. C2R02]
MLGLALKKEWVDAKRQGQLNWLLGIAALLLLVACLSSWQSHSQYVADQQAVSESERARWLNQGDKGPHSAAHYGTYVMKPASSLSLLDSGLQDYQGNVIRLEAHTRNNALFRPIQDTLSIARFGQLSPAFVLQVLLPLLVVLIGFGLVATEREQGTLKQLLAMGVSPARLFFTKTLMLFTIASALLIPVAISILIFNTIELRAGIFLGVYLIYVFIWCLLTVTISSLANSARKALIILLSLWVFTSLLLPKLAMYYATIANPVISSQAFESRLKSDVYTPEREQAIAKFKQQTLAQYKVSTTDQLPFNWGGAQLQFGEQYADKKFDLLFSERNNQLQAQSDTYQQLGILSPFIALQTLSMGLAATDFKHHLHFSAEAEKQRRLIQETLNFNQRDNAHKTTGHYKAGVELWQKIPKFNYQNPSFSQLYQQYIPSFLNLLAWLVALTVLCAFTLKKIKREEQR